MNLISRAIVINDNKLLVINRNKYGFKFVTIPGGHIEKNESPEETVIRETFEETSIKIANPRLIITEIFNKDYDQQFIFLCQYISGEPAIQPETNESISNRLGQNLYSPNWLDIAKIKEANILPRELKDKLISYLSEEFPKEPIKLQINLR